MGIQSKDRNGGKDAHFYFSLQTEMSPEKTQLWDGKPYGANKWTHIAATYNGESTNLFINGAKASSSFKQVGHEFA